MADLEIGARRTEAGLRRPARRPARRAASGSRARAQLPRAPVATPAARAGRYRDAEGTLLGQKVTPIDRVGIYVPGGKAAYPSSRADERDSCAGGRRRRDRDGGAHTAAARSNALVLAAAHVAGVHRVFAIGGAQAVGRTGLRHGDDPARRQDHRPRQCVRRERQAPRVRPGRHRHDRRPERDPGAGRWQRRPDWVAMDLFSQAEHDELAQSILLSPRCGLPRRGASSDRPAAADHAARAT